MIDHSKPLWRRFLVFLVPLMVSWIVRMLPPHVTAKPVRATVNRRY